ncbi:hypothetical protein K1719_036612 [Acacia pycnantha]|nr:hypothetical protein K1719_036612 [Acacia pycnantha]
MAPSPWRSRKRRTPHGTITVEDDDGERSQRKTRTEDGVLRTTSTAVSPEQSTLMDSNASYLPQEIVTNILKRLPVKSLIRFQCVCKDWKNLFKIPSFIAEHVRHSTQQDSILPFKCRDRDYLCLINRDMQVLKYETPPQPSLVDRCDIIGSSNGLLCLDYKSSFILWNPATREVLREPKVPGICQVGFGFSPIVNDYKIVTLSVSRLDGVQVYSVQVFSVSTGSWKEVEKLKGIKAFVAPGFSVDGAIFWFGFCNPTERRLISFDIAAESFALIPIPRSAHVTSSSTLTAYENKLAMLSRTRVEYKSGIESPKSFSSNFVIKLWVIEKCADTSGERWIWTQVYTSNRFPDPGFFIIPMTIWGNEIVGFGIPKGEKVLAFYNLHTNEFKAFDMGKYFIQRVIWHYAESLVSVRNVHIEASSS